jgi:hypothetical protein
MTIGSENLSNGSSTAQDRFSGGVSAYRQNRRAAETGDGELMTRRDGAPLPTRSPGLSPLSQGLEPTGALDRAAKLPSLDMQGLTEPVFAPSGWSDAGGSVSMADHPLLCGLLMELPARGTMPASDWLDRWFEAARSILELLYVQEAKRQ